MVGHGQQLDICLWFPRTDDFGVDLVELAIPPLLRALVTEQRPMRRQLDRGMLLPAIGKKGAGNTGGEFGTQGQALAAAIVEAVHFLRNHIGRLADRPAEYLGLLEHRHFGAAEAIELAHTLEGFDHEGERLGVGAENILGATDGLRGLAHGARFRCVGPRQQAVGTPPPFGTSVEPSVPLVEGALAFRGPPKHLHRHENHHRSRYARRCPARL